jgi:hypothetical protein
MNGNELFYITAGQSLKAYPVPPTAKAAGDKISLTKSSAEVALLT